MINEAIALAEDTYRFEPGAARDLTRSWTELVDPSYNKIVIANGPPVIDHAHASPKNNPDQPVHSQEEANVGRARRRAGNTPHRARNSRTGNQGKNFLGGVLAASLSQLNGESLEVANLLLGHGLKPCGW